MVIKFDTKLSLANVPRIIKGYQKFFRTKANTYILYVPNLR